MSKVLKEEGIIECDLCSNPYPYMCGECDDSIRDEPVGDVSGSVSPPRGSDYQRVWIGSGDSGFPAAYE